MCDSFSRSTGAGRRGADHEHFLIRDSCHAAVLASRGVGAVERSDIRRIQWRVRALLPEFERTSGIKVTTGSGASQGAGPQTIAAQLARGVPANVVILSRAGLSELIAANRIAAGTDVDLARVPLGVAGRAGALKLAVRTLEAFKQVLLKTKT